MRPDLRLSGAVLAGLVWIFVANLFSDILSMSALTIVWFMPPLVVLTLRLRLNAALTCMGIVALLHDATLAIPFGLTASITLPACAILHRLRRHFDTESRIQAAAVAAALTPSIHIVTVIALSLTGQPIPVDPHGLGAEIAFSTLVSAAGTPWLAAFTNVMLTLFGFADRETENAA